jgi:predicted RNase H-like nuclease (RuvC/YqgF family)
MMIERKVTLTYLKELRRQRNRLSAAVERQKRELERLRKRVDEQEQQRPSVYNVRLNSFM